MSLSLKISGNKVHITSMGNIVFNMEYRASNGGIFKSPLDLNIEGSGIEVKFDGCTIWDQITEIEDKLVIARKWKIDQTGPRAIYFDIEAILKDAEVISPAIIYNGNKSGKGLFPKGGLETGWSFREDKLPIPSCSVIYNDKNNFILYTDPASSEEYI